MVIVVLLLPITPRDWLKRLTENDRSAPGSFCPIKAIVIVCCLWAFPKKSVPACGW